MTRSNRVTGTRNNITIQTSVILMVKYHKTEKLWQKKKDINRFASVVFQAANQITDSKKE